MKNKTKEKHLERERGVAELFKRVGGCWRHASHDIEGDVNAPDAV